MLLSFGATLHEIVEVKGEALKENELWAVLQCMTTALSDVEDYSPQCPITPQNVVLLPNGTINFNHQDSSMNTAFNAAEIVQHSSSNENMVQLQSVALTILWCAEYNLERNLPLNISNNLQTLLMTMCDSHQAGIVNHIEEMCKKYAKLIDNKTIISQLCASIIGDFPELYINNESTAMNGIENEIARRPELAHSESSVTNSSRSSNSSQIGFMFGKKYVATIPLERDDALYEALTPKSTSRKSARSPLHLNVDISKNLRKTQPRGIVLTEHLHSILKADQEIKSAKCSGPSDALHSILISFVNHSKVKVAIGNASSTSVNEIIKVAINVFIPNAADENLLSYFALAAWTDSEYCFIDNSTTISKALSEFAYSTNDTYFLRILYFPPDSNSVNSVLLHMMYIQLRSDIINERITCTHDDYLSLAALALQCEFGDYKVEYGCGYFVIDEFLSPHVVLQLGLSYIRSELPALHRQLAGIKEKEARLLFLRRSQNLEEYGMNFHKAYRLKTCKDKNTTWIGVGPRGITIFDIKENFIRIKRHNLKWKELKKISYKNRKIVITKLNPDIKLKFYQKDSSRAKYVVTIIGKLHTFYADHSSTNQFSSLALFDDITKLSSTLNNSLISQATNQSESSSDFETSQNKSPWTYKNPKFTRNRKVIRRHSNSSFSSNITESSNGKQSTSKKSNTNVLQHGEETKTNQDVLQAPHTATAVVHAMQEGDSFVGDDASLHYHDESGDEVEGTSSREEALDKVDLKLTCPTPMPRFKHKIHTSTPQKDDSTVSNALSDITDFDENIHKEARSFYRSSLGGDALLPPVFREYDIDSKRLNIDVKHSSVQE